MSQGEEHLSTVSTAIGKHWPWLLGLIFTGGLLYGKIQENTMRSEATAKLAEAIPLHKLMIDAQKAQIDAIIRKDAEDNRQFLSKLDAVIQKLEQRDETQTKALSAIQVQVEVMNERYKQNSQ